MKDYQIIALVMLILSAVLMGLKLLMRGSERAKGEVLAFIAFLIIFVISILI